MQVDGKLIEFASVGVNGGVIYCSQCVVLNYQ